ncbi:serine hydrolase domain-containing protein [Pseudohongiella spirulinae]|uniref:Beta-lactamase n=1 Tax=Pseudohongiella spirulinae TaxID=1249552 RepID=A0A0S2KGF2_9GAMM|nr:serine hydrolase domain-containing protein [Pseudohongiella spirulinae]ALO47389.1 Beta-lactamase [Pseudohongiella spirulinae]
MQTSTHAFNSASLIRTTCLTALFICALPLTASAQSNGFDESRLARIDQVLQTYVDSGELAGAVALVQHNGRTVYEHAVGWADKESGRAMSTDSMFRIASQTKAMTSVLILSLMEEGKLNLNDPVSRFIPEYASTTVAVQSGDDVTIVPARRQITLFDLLTHTAGISYGTQAHIAELYRAEGLGTQAGNGWYTADKDEPVCTTMERLAGLPFISQPGEAWVYGYNTDVLGCVAERASGMALDELMRTRITEPLQMNDTYFFVPEQKQERLVAVYASDADGKAVRAAEGARGQGSYTDGPRRNFAGGAGLVSTAHDYARFLEMIRSGGTAFGVKILSPRAVALMTTNQIGDRMPSSGRGFGLGFETTDRYGANGMDSVGAFGWGGAYGSMYRVDPTSGISILLMINQLPLASDIRTKYPTMVYQALE